MSPSAELTFFHSPNTRSAGARILLEELGAKYTLHSLNMKKGEQRAPAYLAINPMGKVPALMHRGELICEQVAVLSIWLIYFRRLGWPQFSMTHCAARTCGGWRFTVLAMNPP